MKKKLNLARLDEKQQESVKAGGLPLKPCQESLCGCYRAGWCYPYAMVESGTSFCLNLP
jgi:hypothetical protein